eukprot:4283689-Amphidinium_carterae.1
MKRDMRLSKVKKELSNGDANASIGSTVEKIGSIKLGSGLRAYVDITYEDSESLGPPSFCDDAQIESQLPPVYHIVQTMSSALLNIGDLILTLLLHAQEIKTCCGLVMVKSSSNDQNSFKEGRTNLFRTNLFRSIGKSNMF